MKADELPVKDLFDIDVAYLVDTKDVRHEKIAGRSLPAFTLAEEI